ncbi:MAG: phage portal protein [Patescibacteria group bacterium]|nr:phage portal protein [Patescibacteria group bacterium]
MEINFSLKLGKKKVTKKSATVGTIRPDTPHKIGNDWFYPIGDGSSTDKATLLDMVEKKTEFATPMNYAVRTTARIPVVHLDQNGKQVENSKYLKLLNKPNQYQNSREALMESAILSYLATGDCFFNKIGAPLLVPSKLFVLDPTCTEPIWSDEGDFRFKELLKFKTQFPGNHDYTKIEAGDIAHIMFTGARYKQMTQGGVSLLVPLIENYQNLKKNYIARRSMYEGKRLLISPKLTRGAMPGIGSISQQQGGSDNSEFKFEPPEKAASRKLNQHWRADNPDGERIKVFPTPMETDEIGQTANELGLDESRSADFRFISMQIGVHPILTGDTTNAALNNYKTAERQFYLTSGLPTAYKMYSELTTFLNMPDGHVLIPDTSRIEALKDDKAELHQMILNNYDRRAATANELRAAAGQETSNEYDTLKPNENEQ